MGKSTRPIDQAYEQARRDDDAYLLREDSKLGKTIKKIKEERVRAYRAEARRLVSLANKRVKRLEERDLTNSPAYRGLIENGKPRFSVKGKDYNELQSEVARMERFINAKTSTVRGIENVVKNLAEITNFKYDNVQDLKKNINKFFELSSKVDQYLTNVHDIASAIGYQQIWTSVNQYIEDNEIDLSSSETSIEDLITTVSELIVKQETAINDTVNETGEKVKFNLLD